MHFQDWDWRQSQSSSELDWQWHTWDSRWGQDYNTLREARQCAADPDLLGRQTKNENPGQQQMLTTFMEKLEGNFAEAVRDLKSNSIDGLTSVAVLQIFSRVCWVAKCPIRSKIRTLEFLIVLTL